MNELEQLLEWARRQRQQAKYGHPLLLQGGEIVWSQVVAELELRIRMRKREEGEPA